MIGEEKYLELFKNNKQFSEYEFIIPSVKQN
jgi:hypothetical protein